MRDCRSCAGKCTVISTDCFYENSFYFSQAIPGRDVKKLINLIQTRYILQLITQTCLTELCTAIINSEKDPSDPDYEVLADKWEDLIQILTPLIVSAGEYEYISKRAYGLLTANGFKFNESLKDPILWGSFIKGLKLAADDDYAAAKTWLEDSTNRNNYSCLPTLVTDSCEPEEETYISDWDTTAYRKDYRDRY